jgi:rod shape determining protein RodA
LRKREKRYAGGLLAAGLTMSALLPLAWGMLLDYQQRRILMFLDPTADPKGAGYNLIQSKIAIGSGGIWGKGLARGSQSQLAFLPERHTDFAFSVWAEEWGLVGSLVLLALFGLLIWRLLRVARQLENRFSSLIAYGVAAMIGFHAVFNIGMCLGLFPVAGLPLPFVSYGGSFMLTCWLAVGLVEGLRGERK